MNILIVEDDEQIAEVLIGWARTLNRSGNVWHTTNLEAATEFLRVTKIDSVICDGSFPTHASLPIVSVFNGPRENWQDVLIASRQNGARFVLFSGDARIIERAKRLNCEAFLKPADMNFLMAVACRPLTDGR